MNKTAYNMISELGKKTLGVARKDMPQIKDLPGFLKSLKGIKYEKSVINPDLLKPSQKHIDSNKVDGFKDDVMNKHIVIAKDNHIVDGHHRWAKAVTDDDINKVKVVKIDMPIKSLINKANEFSKAAAIDAFNDELEKIAIKLSVLKKRQIPLSEEERATIMNAGATWNHGINGKPSPAVWKAKHKDKILYVTNTHRAMATAPTLKGAIDKYHNYIESTA